MFVPSPAFSLLALLLVYVVRVGSREERERESKRGRELIEPFSLS
jgi:hypothetical protein